MSKSTKAEYTLSKAIGAMAAQTSSFPEIIRLIHTLSKKNIDVDVSDLAELIQRDSALMVKILLAANTLGYNSGASRVTTVEQAVNFVGFNRICAIAMALMLLEQSNAQVSAAQRTTSALALCAGTFAKEIQHDSVDPDQAFVCASLKLFGRILVATSMPDEYARASASTNGAEDLAFAEIFGLTPVALSFEILQQAQLPEDLLAGIREDPKSKLSLVAEFAAKLSALVCNPTLSAEDFSSRTNQLTATYDAAIPAILEQVPGVLTTSAKQLSYLKYNLGLTSLPASVVERVQCRAANREPSKVPVGKNTSIAAQRPLTALPTDVSLGILTSGFSELRGIAATPASLSTVITALLDTMQSALGASECILFLRQGIRPDFRVAQGTGRAWRVLRDTGIVTQGERSVFGLCLQRQETLLIHDVSSASHIPNWLTDSQAIGSFALMALHAGQEVQGLLLVGWPTKRQVVLSYESMALIKEIVSLVGEKLRSGGKVIGK